MPNKIVPYNPILKEYARKLRKQGILSETLLWKQIKKKALGVEFHRQVPIDNYIVDFYCHELMFAIEIDGNSHDPATDIKRQTRLEELGVHFIRFNDVTVKTQITAVLDALADEIKRLKTAP